MKIFVHSKGRASIKTATLSWLQPLWDRTIIVCPASQIKLYRIHWPEVECMGVPDSHDLPEVMDTIAHGIVGRLGLRRFVMMDDDLRFAYRPDPKVASLVNAAGHPMVLMYRWLYNALSTHAHATISPRQGNNRHEEPLAFAGAARSVLAFRADTIVKHDIHFNRCPSKSDYDATLQLLRLGYRNIISHVYCHDQVGGPTLPGGCTETRTEDIHRAASEALHSFHPAYVKVVVKKKPDWAFPRHDVIVSWKKAYESAVPTYPSFLIKKG